MVRVLATLLTVTFAVSACAEVRDTEQTVNTAQTADTKQTTDTGQTAGGALGTADSDLGEESGFGSGQDAESEQQPIVIPLSLYILIDSSDPTSGRSSTRTVAELETVAAEANEIWSQAGIVFDPISVRRIETPPEVLIGIAAGDTDPFFATVGQTFDVPDTGLINGFYVPVAFGTNGFAPFGSRVFFVVDQPTVPDARVTSHEIGHIFGLHHDLVDPGHLMFSGTDGTILDTEERTVARYGATGLLER